MATDDKGVDCYHKAEPDEPRFTLLGRDKHAPILLEMWAAMREFDFEDPDKVAEARDLAKAMRAFRKDREERRLQKNFKHQIAGPSEAATVGGGEQVKAAAPARPFSPSLCGDV